LPKITEQFIKEKLLTEGISHLCLIVTDACNFRCKYCIYSDHYFYSKNFSNKRMERKFNIVQIVREIYFALIAVR